MNSINSYTNLNKMINFYSDWINDFEKKSTLSFDCLKDDLVIVSLSMIWLNKDLSEIDDFQSNRYFIDSIKVNSLCSEKELLLFADQVGLREILFSICNQDYKNNYAGLKFLASKMLKIFYEKIGLNNDIQNQWNGHNKTFYNKNGYVVIPNVLSEEECDDYRKVLINIAEEEKLNGEGYFYGFHNKFQRIYNLINKSQKLGELLTLPIVSFIMNDLFDRNTLHDKYTLSSWHSNIIGPNGEEQKLHIDSAVPEPLPPWIIRANINFILEDYTDNNGATICLPESHNFLHKPTKVDEEKFKNKFIKMIAPKGSMVIWSGHLWHKSGKNNTNNERVALLACFAASHLVEMALEENHPLVVSKNNLKYFSDDLKKLILFEHGLKQGSKSKSSFFR
jgi:hypothetical protein